MYYECRNCGRDLQKVEGMRVHVDTGSDVCWTVFAYPMLP